MKLVLLIAWLAAALATPVVAWAGDQAYISWTLGDQDGRPTVTWKITGSTKWYVGTIQIASDRRVAAGGHFLPENVVAYEVLEPDRPPGFWVGPVALQPGTYLRSPATPLRRSVQRQLPVRHVGAVASGSTHLGCGGFAGRRGEVSAA